MTPPTTADRLRKLIVGANRKPWKGVRTTEQWQLSEALRSCADEIAEVLEKLCGECDIRDEHEDYCAIGALERALTKALEKMV